MHFLATGRILRPKESAAHVPEEACEFDRLHAEGFIQESSSCGPARAW
ncbi:hypothetical protein [Amycolatopsis sp. NPDC051372]